MFTLPANVLHIDLPILKIGFDEVGILYVSFKQGTVQTFEEARFTISELKNFLGGKKVCILLDVTYFGDYALAMRNYTIAEICQLAKAIAILSAVALGRMLVNLFFSLHLPSFPVKMFDDEITARTWLLKNG